MRQARRLQDRLVVECERVVRREELRRESDQVLSAEDHAAADQGRGEPPQTDMASLRQFGCDGHRPTLGSSAACTMSVTRKISETSTASASVRPWITG